MDKRIILFSFLLIIGSGVSSQESYQIPKKATVNASDSDQDLFPQIIYRGEVSDGMSSLRTDHLQKVKSRVQKRYPRKTGIKDNSLRGAGPKVLQSFEGIQGSLGIPLDNHLAVSNNGHVVTVANFHLVIYDDSANISTAISLIQLTRDLRLPDFRYDPRIIYDTEEDRFILTMLHSSDRDRTLILVGFSETSDPNGNWHFYTIDGNPFDINIFSDYPMV
ncbi:MAG: hypothetical protein R3275_13565, partial [Saprospiraceae bacterium]|nr:hypothetical protein [Saprospiraceae bacterium]